MKDFFISYTRADRNWAEWIAWQIEEAGYQVTIQAWDFRPGGNFALGMQNAAVESERTIAVLSPDFFQSEFTQPEVAAAFAKDPAGKKGILVPVRVRECNPEGLFGQIVYIDLVGLSEKDAIDVLLKGIQRGRLKPALPPAFPFVADDRTVTILPPFPTTLGEELTEGGGEEALIGALPHPLAAPFAQLLAARSESEQFAAFDYALKNTVKYLTAVAISQYWQDDPDREELRSWLGDLSNPRLLVSLQPFNRLSDAYLKSLLKPSLYPVLFERYLAAIANDSPIGRADIMLQAWTTAKEEDSNESITPQDFLVHLLTFRQMNWENNPYAVAGSLRRNLLPALRAALTQFLTLFTPLFRYGLYYIERIDRDGQDWLYTLVEFSGPQGKPVTLSEVFREQGVDVPSYKANRLYLCSPQNQPVLNLQPLLISHLYEIYFLEYIGESKVLWYSHCCSPKRYNPPTYYRFLSTLFEIGADERIPEDDLVSDLQQAGEELANDEVSRRVEEMPAAVLLSHVSTEVREALEIGLGEALRIGQFWLGTEFLLMGLSKQAAGTFARKLAEIGIQGRQLRSALRGMVHIAAKDWQRQQNVRDLGIKNLPAIQEIDPIQLANKYASQELPNAVLTPRLLSILREAIRLADGGKISTSDFLLELQKHWQNQAIKRLLELVADTKHDPVAWIRELTPEIEGKTLLATPNPRQLQKKLSGDKHQELVLEILNGPLDGHVIILESGTEWTRAPERRMAFPWDDELGEPQCRFIPEQKRWWIEPVRSAHHTYVLNRDMRILEKTALQLGDILKASKTWLWIKDIS
jgi:hypothetical protein